MSSYPAAGYISNAARTEGEGKQFLEDVLQLLKEQPGGSAETTLVLASDVATPTGPVHALDTEGGLGTDDCQRLVTTNHPDGRWLLVHSLDAAKVVTLKHGNGGDGGLLLRGNLDVELFDPAIFLLFYRAPGTTKWKEVFRGNPASLFSRVLNNKGTAGTPYVVKPVDSGALFTDIGAGAINYHALPGGASYVGHVHRVAVTSANGVRIVAAGGETITDGATTSAPGGYQQGTTAGGYWEVEKISATQWYVRTVRGTVGAPT